jgi:tellurite resistance protein TerC
MITIPGINPFWMWAGFLALVVLMLELDIGLLNRKDHVIGIRESLLWTLFWFTCAMAFNAWLWWQFGFEIGLEFFTGYIIEKSLSMDNLFVFLLIFTAFNIPRIYQHRVLYWGIVGAVFMRGMFIWLGSELVSRFEWVFLIFGVIILWGAWRMQFQKEKDIDVENNLAVRIVRKFFPVTSRLDGHKFFIIESGKRMATVLFVALITIEFTDVIFATDSIPAIFAITTDPFIVFTSNIFAILGLRSLYFAIAGLHAMFVYLKTGLAIILGFIGVKMLLTGGPALLHVFGVSMPLLEKLNVPIMASLVFIICVLVLSVVASLFATKGHPERLAVEPEREAGHVYIPVTPKGLKERKKGK